MAAEPAGRPATHTPPVLTVLSRAECPLCEEFLAALTAWGAGRAPFELRVVDISEDPALEARYTWRIPVLLAGTRELCAGHFDPLALDALPL